MHYASNISALINIHDALLPMNKDVYTAWEKQVITELQFSHEES